jgi:light-regulated signal transduction histidine kinase (bacteriophytochrome)
MQYSLRILIFAMHGGRVWVESEVGAVSTFFVEVPVDVEQQVGNP